MKQAMTQRERVARSLEVLPKARGRVVVPRRRLANDVVAGAASQPSMKRIMDIAVQPVSPSPKEQSLQNKKPRDYTRINRKLARTARLLIIYEKLTAASQMGGEKRSAKRRLKEIMSGNSHKKLSGVAASILLLVSVYSLVDSWLLNNRIKDTVNTATVAARSDNPNDRRSNEGKDEIKVSGDAIAKYKVAADLPRVITIEKLGVKARVLPMSVNADGSMQSPVNIFDTGWYTGSVKPGQPGASIIIGHASGMTLGGIFNKLESLNVGDTVSVERGDGQMLRYQVVKKQIIKLSDVDMNSFMRPADGVSEGLNLMTCAGEWIKNSQTRDHRAMIFTKRI